MFKLEVKDNIYSYIDTDTKNRIEIELNYDPILDCNFHYTNDYLLNNFALLKYAIEDIKTKYNNLLYISKNYNKKLIRKLESLEFKIQVYDIEIPYKARNIENKLQKCTDESIAKKYILNKLNEHAKINSEYLNNKFVAYTEKIFDIEKEKYTIETLEKNNRIKGAVEYYIDDKLYIRNIFADTTEYLAELIDRLLTKKSDLVLGCMSTYKDLLDVLKQYSYKIDYTYFIWKEEENV